MARPAEHPWPSSRLSDGAGEAATPHRAGGQVLVVALLAIVLLTGMVIFVLNVGDQLNHRLALQNAADAAALGAGTHMAKAMNVVAVDNVGMARMLAAVIALDCQPEHIATSTVQADALHQSMIAQSARGAGPAGPLQAPTRTSLQTIRDELQVESLALHAAGLALAGLDVTQYTHYVVPGQGGDTPHGSFWRTARDLGRLSDATVSSVSVGTQKNAYDYGWASQASRSFAIPILPAFPAFKAQWQDWHRKPAQRQSLLVNGWLPENDFAPKGRPTLAVVEPYTPAEVETLVKRSGPFAKLFRWRDYLSLGGQLQTSMGYIFSGGGGFGWSPGQDQYQWTGGQIVNYRTYGPLGWMRNRIGNFWRNRLRYAVAHYRPNPNSTGVDTIEHDLESTKLRYMFDPDLMGSGDTKLEPYHYPEWDTDYTHCQSRAAGGEEPELTAHFRLLIVGPYAANDARVAQIATDPKYGNFQQPLLLLEGGWQDRQGQPKNVTITMLVHVVLAGAPSTLPASLDIRVPLSLTHPWQKIESHIWHVEFRSDEFRQKLEQGKDTLVWPRIHRQLLAYDPNLPAQPPLDYSMEYEDPPNITIRDVFAGADFGHDEPIRNPANFAAQDIPYLPVPYLLDRSAGDYELNVATPELADHDAGVRREQFSFLGVARRSTKPRMWAARFGTDAPEAQMTAIAQVQLFNTTSWDLWTQRWRAQLVPVTGLEDWITRLQQRAGGDAAATSLTEDDLDSAADYLQRVSNMDDPADTLIRH